MDWNQIVPIAVQLPVVFLFIWYADRKDSQFREFLREERQARERQNDAFIKELDNNTNTLNDFRHEMNTAISQMRERTNK